MLLEVPTADVEKIVRSLASIHEGTHLLHVIIVSNGEEIILRAIGVDWLLSERDGLDDGAIEIEQSIVITLCTAGAAVLGVDGQVATTDGTSLDAAIVTSNRIHWCNIGDVWLLAQDFLSIRLQGMILRSDCYSVAAQLRVAVVGHR